MIQTQYIQKLNQNKILTASPQEVITLLYDGAIKFCNMALLGFENNDIEKININIQKAERIIEELVSSLNFDYPVSNDFLNIYKFIYQLLLDANVKKDKEKLERALVELREIKDIWRQIISKKITFNN